MMIAPLAAQQHAVIQVDHQTAHFLAVVNVPVTMATYSTMENALNQMNVVALTHKDIIIKLLQILTNKSL